MWHKNIVLAEVITTQAQKELLDQRIEELHALVATFGSMTVLDIVQQRKTPDYQTYLGSGKVEEIIELMKEKKATLLILWNILKPAQLYNLNEILRKHDMEAWDRVDLILNIFDRHAKSTEAKLQIELAAIKHMGPRIFGMGMELSRQWGGIGTSGIGETNTEIMRRHLATRKKQIEKELAHYEKVRATHRKSRKRKDLTTIGLVWYTNAGKSTLMNALTNKGVLVEDKLFATLGTDVGDFYIPSMTGKGTLVLVNDTIGFIRDLPPGLINAFKSTLEDSVEADILLHMVDAADPMIEDKITVVDEILAQIGAKQERILVFNKMDAVDDEARDRAFFAQLAEAAEYDQCVFLAAAQGEGVEELKGLIEQKVVSV